jgi:hypothetical protein
MHVLARLALCLATALPPAAVVPAAAAQSPAPSAASAVAPGARVRVTRPGRAAAVGSVVAVRPDTLVVHWTARGDSVGDTTAVSTAEVVRLEVSRGMHRRPWRGAGLGLLAGGGIGALVGAVTYTKPNCDAQQFICLDFGRGFAAAVVGGAGGILGAVVGGVIGAQRVDRWQRVPLGAGRARVGVTLPRAGARGAGFAAAVSF